MGAEEGRVTRLRRLFLQSYAVAAAELERRKARAAEERRQRRIEKCARTIQATWRTFKLAREAEEAPAKKGKGKKKK